MLCEHDLPHLGALCCRIRESRSVRRKDIADWCHVVPSTITRFENEGRTHLKTFDAYVAGLQSKDLVRSFRPLRPEKANILRTHYETPRQGGRKALDAQREAAAIKLSDIKSRKSPPELKELIADLHDEYRPAFIMDDLWFMHAMNGAVLSLFGIVPGSNFMSEWFFWNVLGTKFHPESEVRKKHADPDQYFPHAIVDFFESPNTNHFLFTTQLRWLICRIIELSEKHDYDFLDWWLRATAFDLPYKLQTRRRALLYKGDTIHTEARARYSSQIQADGGQLVRYTFVAWDAMMDAHKAFREIAQSPKANDIYFAADFDTHGTFHVNAWPEVRDVIRSGVPG